MSGPAARSAHTATPIGVDLAGQVVLTVLAVGLAVVMVRKARREEAAAAATTLGTLAA